MNTPKKIRTFFFGQHLADGIRVTLEIVIPSVIFALMGDLKTGMILSLGALCVSISDGPGPVVHKRNGMLYCNIFIFLMALITGFVNTSILSLGIFVLFSTFFFSMFSVFGNRAGSIGSAALLIMILRMSHVLPASDVLFESFLVLAGGVWYMVIALLFYQFTPFRPAQRALGECIDETANYLEIKARLYDVSTDLEKEYRRLIDQQIKVNEKQNEVRELLFKNRAILKESTHYGRVLVLTFTYVVDLFENIMATWYDYSSLRQKYKNTGVLEEVHLILMKITEEMHTIGEAIHSQTEYMPQHLVLPELEKLKQKIDQLSDAGSTFMLKKILVNLRNLNEKVEQITQYFKEDLSGKKTSAKDYSKFVSHQKIDGTIFKNNLTLASSTFRHALRVMITCGVGFAISKFISQGHHSYWIIMTITIIMKPSFGLTKEKNYDRLIGTLAGAVIGLVILAFVKDPYVLFGLTVFFMIGTYTFVRLNYIVMVIFLTPYVLILLDFLGLGALNVANERLSDTAIACGLSFLASYFLFPSWEVASIFQNMTSALKANIDYLQKLKEIFTGRKISSLSYKLIRKEMFVSTANLSAALHRMLSEPKSKQRHKKEIYEFVVLNHVLSSNIASITSTQINQPQILPSAYKQQVSRTLEKLYGALQNLGDNSNVAQNEVAMIDQSPSTFNDPNLKDQLVFIHKVSEDILKLTKVISPQNNI